MKILDRLPINDRPHVISVGEDQVEVHRNQIIVWISIGNVLRPFPAVLDTGHGHNLSLSERHLSRWSGATLKLIGDLIMNNREAKQYEASVRVHRNVPTKFELRGDTFPLEMPQGITVLPEGPRLPLLGLRTIVANKLKLFIDGDKQHVTLKKGWL